MTATLSALHRSMQVNRISDAKQRVFCDALGLVAWWRCTIDTDEERGLPPRLRERLSQISASYASLERAREVQR